MVSEQNEISGLQKIEWENHSWKYLSLIDDERVINLQRTKVYVFSDSVLCFWKIFENSESNDAWERRLGWLKSSQNYRNFERIDDESMELECNIFTGFNTLQLSEEVKSLLYRLWETSENFRGRILFMSMFNVISCGTKVNEEECLTNTRLVSLYARRFGKRQWSFIDPGSEKKVNSISEDSSEGIWDKIAERMLLEFAETGCPIFRATIQLSRDQLKSKGRGKLSIHYAVDQETIETIFRIIDSANQLSLYGAVGEMCEEYESLHERTGRSVVMGQSSSSLVLSGAIKTEVPLDSDFAAYQNFLLKQYGERVEKLSEQDKLSKFCMVTEFLSLFRMDSISWRKTLEISRNFIQWAVVNILSQEKTKHHNRKGSKWTSKLDPYRKLQPVICTINMELRSEFGLWTKTTLTSESEFLMNQISLWWIWTNMKQKFPKINSKNIR